MTIYLGIDFFTIPYFEVPTRDINNSIPANGRKDAPTDRFFEPYLTPMTP